VDPERPAREAWKEIEPERKDAILDSTRLVGGKLALVYLKDAATHLEVHDLDGKLLRELPLPDMGTASNLVGREDEDEAYFEFKSYTHPPEIFRTSVARGGAELYSRVKLAVDPSLYETEQVFATSKDGARVPVFVVHRKGAPREGKAPALLYGYGGFNVAVTPAFKGTIYPWLERGGVYAEAILRGGSEYGEDWHRAGMLQNKQRVFDDFIAARKRWSRKASPVLRSWPSAAGRTAGCWWGRRRPSGPTCSPWCSATCPLIDMLRYHLYGSGKTWIPEYGSADDPEQFKYLAAYSPLQQVREGVKYPATLVLSADADDRVDPMHARKLAAALQHSSTGGPVLLRIEQHSGHGGADLVKAVIRSPVTSAMCARVSLAMSTARCSSARLRKGLRWISVNCTRRSPSRSGGRSGISSFCSRRNSWWRWMKTPYPSTAGGAASTVV